MVKDLKRMVEMAYRESSFHWEAIQAQAENRLAEWKLKSFGEAYPQSETRL